MIACLDITKNCKKKKKKKTHCGETSDFFGEFTPLGDIHLL
jgi:hypothetical protein